MQNTNVSLQSSKPKPMRNQSISGINNHHKSCMKFNTIILELFQECRTTLINLSCPDETCILNKVESSSPHLNKQVQD